jgi:putative sterol carrier protein
MGSVREEREAVPRPSGFDTETLARLIGTLSDEELKAGLAKNADVLIAEIFRRIPDQVSDEAKQQDGVVQFKIGGRRDAGSQRWFIVLRDGGCEVGRNLDLKPRVTLSMSELSFLKLVTGNVNPIELFLSRRLRIRGDLVFAARLQAFFEIPRRRP